MKMMEDNKGYIAELARLKFIEEQYYKVKDEYKTYRVEGSKREGAMTELNKQLTKTE